MESCLCASMARAVAVRALRLHVQAIKIFVAIIALGLVLFFYSASREASVSTRITIYQFSTAMRHRAHAAGGTAVISRDPSAEALNHGEGQSRMASVSVRQNDMPAVLPESTVVRVVEALTHVPVSPFEERDTAKLPHQAVWQSIADAFRTAPPPGLPAVASDAVASNDTSGVVPGWNGPHPPPPRLRLSITELANGLTLLPDDVVLCLSATVDMIDSMARVRAGWNGPAALGIFCTHQTCVDEVYANLLHLAGRVRNTAVVVVLADPSVLYPINAMRNIVADYVPAGRGYGVLWLDSDMLLSDGSYEVIRRAYVEGRAANAVERRLLVIPCFEFGTNSYDIDHANPDTIPRNMLALIRLARQGLLRPSKMRYYPQGHSCTEYRRWVFGDDKVPWKQSTYNWEYEPFFVVNKTDDLPGLDESYSFWGGDKQSMCLLLYSTGYRFYTVPMVFSVHMAHPDRRKTATAAGEAQIIANRRMFADFRREVAHRYKIDVDSLAFKRVGFPKYTIPERLRAVGSGVPLRVREAHKPQYLQPSANGADAPQGNESREGVMPITLKRRQRVTGDDAREGSAADIGRIPRRRLARPPPAGVEPDPPRDLVHVPAAHDPAEGKKEP